jgi:hypothetical protein
MIPLRTAPEGAVFLCSKRRITMSPTDLTPASFYTYNEEGKIAFFRKPSVSELDRFTSKVAKAPISASIAFCENLVLDSSKTAWKSLIEELPGAASSVSAAITEKLGFRQ